MTDTASSKVIVETLSQRLVRNIRDSRLVKLINAITSFSIKAQINFNGRPVNSLLTFLILVFGVAYLVKSVYKYILKPVFYPVWRHFLHWLI